MTVFAFHKCQGGTWDDFEAAGRDLGDPYADDPRWSRPIIMRSPAFADFLSNDVCEHLKAMPDA